MGGIMAGTPSLAARRRATTLVICLLSSVAILTPLSAANAARPVITYVLPESGRTVAGGRSVEVTVSQGEIKANAFSAMAASGGMFGGLLGASVDAANGKTAEERIGSVRDALLDFDADGLAIETTRRALGAVDWMQPADIKFSKDSTVLGEMGFLDGGEAAQAAFIGYTYEMAQDFSYVRVVATLQFANKALPANSTKPESRLQADKLAYMQTVICDVTLPKPGADGPQNAQLWAADDGKLVKQALTKAFADVEALMPRALALSDADVSAMNDAAKPVQKADGLSGRVVETADGHVLIWQNGYVQADRLPQNP